MARGSPLQLAPRTLGISLSRIEPQNNEHNCHTPPSDDDPRHLRPRPIASQSGRVELPPTKGRLPLDCPNLDSKTRKGRH